MKKIQYLIIYKALYLMFFGNLNIPNRNSIWQVLKYIKLKIGTPNIKFYFITRNRFKCW